MVIRREGEMATRMANSKAKRAPLEAIRQNGATSVAREAMGIFNLPPPIHVLPTSSGRVGGTVQEVVTATPSARKQIRDANDPRSGQCEICLDRLNVWTRTCCQVQICQACLEIYVVGKVHDGAGDIQCPGHHCDINLTPGIIKGALDNSLGAGEWGGSTNFSFAWLRWLLSDDDWYAVFYTAIPLVRGQCTTCLDIDLVSTQKCCKLKICQACLEIYVGGKISDGVIDIQCPGHNCDTHLSPDIIKGTVDATKAKRFSFLLVKSGRCKYKKACPMCDYVVTLDDAYLKFYDSLESIIVCPNLKCLKEWCFQCMVPWHESYTCAEFKSFETDTGVDKWAEKLENTHKERNAQQCPSCKVWIQKIVGCYFMTCKECKTNFCYNCGVRTPHATGAKCVHARTGVHEEIPAAARPAARRPAAPRPAPHRQAPRHAAPNNRFEIQDPEQAGLPVRRHQNKLVAHFTTRNRDIMWFRCAIVFVFAFLCAIGIIAHGFFEAFVRPYDN